MGKSPTQSLSNSYYQNILTSEYRSTVQFRQWLNVVLSMAEDISNCLQSITASFDLDAASGVQLDVLGIIVGVSRVVPFQPSDSVSPILDDTTYRILLKATIANNQWNGKIGSLYPIWTSLFPTGTISILDHQNMTATIIIGGVFSSILQDLITNGMIIPRPQAVAYDYTFSSNLPLFGFDSNNSFIAGFDTGKWG